MQTRLKIALAAIGFALATIPAFAVEMPTDGSKNFSTPNDAPSYFTNETAPESARVDRAATFSSEDVAAAPEDGPAVSAGTETGHHAGYASSHRSTRQSRGRSRGHGASMQYVKATSSRGTTSVGHNTATHTYAGSGSASAAKAAGKSVMPAAASRSNTTRHAKTSAGQHASAIPPGPLLSQI